MLLFPDFDGILHPRATNENLFVHIPRVKRMLREFQHVQGVIFSSWREVTTLHEMQVMFSEDMRQRIIGTTPLIDIKYPHGSAGGRGKKIHSYMDQPELIGRNWLALDDDASFFTPGCANLILYNSLTGLDDEVEIKLREGLLYERQ